MRRCAIAETTLAFSPDSSIGYQPEQAIKTVKDTCTLQVNALTIRVSDQIEPLDDFIGDEVTVRAFFADTHITQGMNTLVTEAIARSRAWRRKRFSASNTQWAAELAVFLRRKLINLCPEQAQAAEILEQLLPAQRLE